MTATGPDMDSSRAIWRKSTRSNGGEGACVEMAVLNEDADDE
ncbi:DUF397 domain-containing protein [Actinoallomurus sp. NPDC052274]